MNRMRIGWLTLLAGVVVGGTVQAGEIGDAAAPLEIKTWVKGKPVNLTEGKDKKIYVVEFWATWCPPCRTSIPHLTEMQAKFKDKGVVIIGVSDEPAEKVRPFVENMGDKMAYVVACDDERKTNKAYMQAFAQQGIPTAFIIDKSGQVVWVGHPMFGLDETIQKVVDGKWDVAEFKKQQAEEMAAQRKMMAVAMKLEEYFELAKKPKKSKKMKKLAAAILNDGGKNPMLMNEFSWTILTDEDVKHRDIATAVKAAKLAYDATNGSEPAVIDTYARALFMEGKVEEAIAEQKRAIELCKDARMLEGLKKALKEYEDQAAKKA